MKAYPDFIGVVGYMSGEYDVFPDLADIPPAVKYVNHSLYDEKIEALLAARAILSSMGIKKDDSIVGRQAALVYDALIGVKSDE